MSNYFPSNFIGPGVELPAIAQVNSGITYGLGGDDLTGTDTNSSGGNDVTASSVRIAEIAYAGEAITAGDAIYIDRDDDLAYLADASVANKPGTGDTLAVALNNAVTGQTVGYASRSGDKISYLADTFEQGLWYVVGTTAGDFVASGDLASTDYSILVGYAETNAIFVFTGKRTGVEVNITP